MTGNLVLLGGTTYQAGNYLVAIGTASGSTPAPITYTPYVPWTNISVTIPASTSNIAAGFNQSQTFQIPIGVVVHNAIVTVAPGAYPGMPVKAFDFFVQITAAPTATAMGTGVVYAKNNSFQSYAFPSTLVNVGIN